MCALERVENTLYQWMSMGQGQAEDLREWCAIWSAPRVSSEKPCPAAFGNRTATCERCLGCGGRRNGPKHVGFVVQAHGTKGMKRAFNRKVL